MLPKDLKYTKDHEWIKIEGERATLGITDYAQKELGDVVFVDLPAAGEKVAAHAAMASIESVKAVSEVFAPLSGEVMEINDTLEHSPEFVNQDPYGKGWIAVIEIANAKEIAELINADAYAALIAQEK